MKNGISVLGIVLVAALAVAAPAWAEMKIGVIDPQKVLEGTKSGKKIMDSLNDYVKIRQKMMESEEEDLKKLQEDLVKQSAVLSPEAKREKEESFNRKVMEARRKGAQLEQEVQSKKKEVLGEFTKNMEQVIRAIAEREKLTLVFDKADSGIPSAVIYSHPSLDLTERVIKELDAKGGK